MTTLYCSASDLYAYGIPYGGLPNPGRLVAAVNTTTNVFSLDGHGFATNTELLFRAESGGSLPSPLAEGTTYYAIVVSDSAFKVSTSSGGSALDITTAGSNTIVVSPLPVDEWIEWASRYIDSHLTGHMVPLSEPIDVVIKAAAADLAATRGLALTGGGTVDLSAKQAQVQDQLRTWLKGHVLPAASGHRSGNLSAWRNALSSDSRGWDTSGDGGIP
jgi:hypothetical protein